MNNDIIVGGIYKFEPTDYASPPWLPGVVEVIDHGDGWFAARVIEGVKTKETDEWCNINEVGDIIVHKGSLFHIWMSLIDDPREFSIVAANNYELSFDDVFCGLDCCS